MIEKVKQPDPHANSNVLFADTNPMAGKPVSLRKFPFPFQAAMTICSDIDETRSSDEFLEIQRFLNTRSTTSMGNGIGLEIGNSFFFYNHKKEFSYFDQDDRAKQITQAMIQSGYIDCLHSYGDTDNRDDIVRALDSLESSNCQLEVWINHYGVSNDICKKFEYMFRHCEGDDPQANAYHTDLTLAHGIRFAWVGATTRIVGQSTRPKLTTAFDPRYPLVSTSNVMKEVRKQFLGRTDERFALHRSNDLLRPLKLADGGRVHEFIRYCNHPEGVPIGATSRGLAYVISKRNLANLISREGYMIAYAHLGKNEDRNPAIAPESQAALRHLAMLNEQGDIYVSTTAKILKYKFAHQSMVATQVQQNGREQITIHGFEDSIEGRRMPSIEELQGITFYVDDSRHTDIFLGSQQIDELQRNPADKTGRPSVTIPLHSLCFPDV